MIRVVTMTRTPDLKETTMATQATTITAMEMTRSVIRGIKAACRKVCGGRRSVEVGERWWPGQDAEAEDGFNSLRWGEDNDLFDTVRIDDLMGKVIRDRDGWVALDCYCYNLPLFGQEPYDALDTNVEVLLNPGGEVMGAWGVGEDIVGGMNRILRAHGQEPLSGN
jgi:hypothetical protein